ncbi:MAG TPA: cyclic nucleotide-binding domain-containing protein [Candidatus Binatia bacterium]|nr:cyclic nucleotide-binding domain-containing protein [Candidatus Binatia bacterium]
MAAKRDILKGNALFKSFSDDIIDRFLNSAETRTYSPGDIIFAELSEGDEIFMILEGEVTAQVALVNADQNLEILTLSAGQVFGEGCFFKPNVPRYATITSKTTTTVLVWKSEVWRDIAESNFEVGYRLAVGIASIFLERLRHWNTRIAENISWGLD